MRLSVHLCQASRPTRGAWIEMLWCSGASISLNGRAPHGARGLKFGVSVQNPKADYRRAPHGARGLKFCIPVQNPKANYCRAPHGARGLKYSGSERHPSLCGRAPHGARGLKCDEIRMGKPCCWSRPTRGAWIEIKPPVAFAACRRRAPHGARGLKSFRGGPGPPRRCRAPHGARGLKS